jgi:glycosyltransferase involved in cell wall biosynthesis
MRTVSLVGSISRRAGGLFESVRRLDQELVTVPSSRVNEGCSSSAADSVHVEVSVLATNDDRTAQDQATWPPVPVQTFQCFGPRCFGYAPGLARELKRLDPELVHVHGLWQFAAAAALHWHWRSRRPYMVSVHGMLDPWALRHSQWKKRIGWFAYQRRHLDSAACIRALCNAEVDALRKLGLTRPVCVIPNGVDLPSSAPPVCCNDSLDELKSWGLDRRKVLLYLGRLHPKKGLMSLLRAWAQVQGTAANWALVIAGWDQSNHEQSLKRLATELGLRWTDSPGQLCPKPSVCFIGPKFGEQKNFWLRECGAFVLPSLSEGLPMAVLEAWAAAKPVLMSDQCNLPDGFTTGAAIRLEAAPHRIAAGLSQLFRMRGSELRQMGARGRALVASRYTWRSAAAELKLVYAWVLGLGPKPSCVLPH